MKINVIIPCAPDAKVYAKKSLNSQGILDKDILVISGKNPSKNRNIGVEKSRGDLVAFTNAHSFFDKSWKNKVTSFFKKYPNVDIVGGPQFTSKNENLFERVTGAALSSVFGAANVRNRYISSDTEFDIDETKLTSANLICKKSVFDKIKFDENIYPGEDPKFISDAKKSGMLVSYCGDIIAYNKRRTSFSDLFSQIFSYGKVRPQKESFLSTLKNPFFFIPSVFVIGTISILLLAILHSFTWILILDFYIALSLMFSIYESFKNKQLSYFFILPWIFFTIHVGYGIGMIWGYLKKIIK